ncbi:MAG TPA: SpoIIE family protein phosphatase [Ignavibacteriaceae bacterium]|nr:SpoIIE family protein phosphatase [Ignavibacteriaceae bacterium]
MFVLPGCKNDSQSYHKVTFQITVQNPLDSLKVFITGNHQKLGDWFPGSVVLEKVNPNIFKKTISFKEGTDLEFKITAGNWWLEAFDSEQNIYNNFQLEVEKDTIIKINVSDWKNTFINGRILLTEKRFQPGRTTLGINDFWKYHPGDNLEWANENFDDSDWITTDSRINFESSAQTNSYIQGEKQIMTDWDNIGWFRFHMYVDSSLWNKTLGIFIGQLGASEIYYNGKLLYSVGKIGISKSNYKPEQNRLWKEIKIDPKYKQLIAIRYANYNWKEQADLGFDPGFIIFVKDLNTAISEFATDIRKTVIHQMAFSLVPSILFLLHLLLYSFYRKQKANLFYSFCMLGFAGITYFGFERYVSTEPSVIILYYQLNAVSSPVTIFFGLLTAYAIIYKKLPKRWMVYAVIFISIVLLEIFNPVSSTVGLVIYFFFGLTIIDIFLSALKGKNQINRKGRWIILSGFMILSLFIVYQILIDYSVLPSPSFIYNNQVFVYGMLGLAISMSIFLSFNFSQINKDLELQLEKVKELSDKTIEQERTAYKLELERRIIEAENNRKTKELSDARNLQLSLLPKEIPEIKNLDIACYMNTATEVGGDYYDIISGTNGEITLVIGDATGHGVKAGTLVAIVKGLIHELSPGLKSSEVLEKINRVIRSMNLGNLYMGLTLLKLNNLCIDISTAGMPPVFIYRKNKSEIEEIIFKRMPLGATNKMNFIQQKLKLNQGDIILLLSDGLPELFNSNRDMFDYKRIKEILLQNVDKNSSCIVENLKSEAEKWRNGFDQKDDMTFVVVKCKDNLRE